MFDLEMSRRLLPFSVGNRGATEAAMPMKSGFRYRRNRLKWGAKRRALKRQ